MISSCRVCGNTALLPVGGLGDQFLSSLFPETLDYRDRIPSWPLDLVLCERQNGRSCGLLQLAHHFDLGAMYEAYPYTSASNASMKSILFDVAESGERWVDLSAGDTVLDIGGNDGTLLAFFRGRDLDLICIDAARNVQPSFDYKHVRGFFTSDLLRSVSTRQAKLIFSVAMFYHLGDPMRFVQEVAQSLSQDGVLVIQMAYLPAMLKTNMYDNIVHEHAGYYGLYHMRWIIDACGLEIFDVETNDVYGGSFRVFAQHRGAGRPAKPGCARLLSEELSAGIFDTATYHAFMSRIRDAGQSLKQRCTEIRTAGGQIWVYGASTKGNTILQFSQLGIAEIQAAADANPFKMGRFMVGSNVPIRDEESMRRARPEYLLALPYSFVDRFIEREAELVDRGTRFITPLPSVRLMP
jgi:SAM-dependent methyltransferase